MGSWVPRLAHCGCIGGIGHIWWVNTKSTPHCGRISRFSVDTASTQTLEPQHQLTLLGASHGWTLSPSLSPHWSATLLSNFVWDESGAQMAMWLSQDHTASEKHIRIWVHGKGLQVQWEPRERETCWHRHLLWPPGRFASLEFLDSKTHRGRKQSIEAPAALFCSPLGRFWAFKFKGMWLLKRTLWFSCRGYVTVIMAL
jgi:hypothetical protein